MKGVLQFTLVRLMLIPVTVLVLVTIVFLLLRVAPGDPAQALLGGRDVPEEKIEQTRERLGLNDPVYVQYGNYLWKLLHGDLGRSISKGEAVISIIQRRLPATLELAAFSILIATLIGLAGGIVAARTVDSSLDHGIRFVNIGLFGTPIFWLALMLILVFNVWLGWFPSPSGRLTIMHQATFSADITGFLLIDSLLKGNWSVFGDAVHHLTLPALSIGLVLSGFMSRMTRTNMIEVLGQDYIRSARSKGVGERTLTFKHALRNALIPIITVQGLLFAILMGGAVLTESVFNINGFGTFILETATTRDYNAIQGTVVVIALLVSVINLLVDVAYAVIDPRVQY